jgi:hypothetical protein
VSVNDPSPDPGAPDGPWIVITGDPVEGFIFTGPFNNHADAERWAEGQQDWWTGVLQPPEKDEAANH